MSDDDVTPPPAPRPAGHQADLFGGPESAAPAPLSESPDQRLRPSARAAHARAVYLALRAHLAATVVGHERARDHLALLGATHVLGLSERPVRACLVGPSGTGKTTLARALAEGLGLPFAIVDVTELAETNWQGLQLADVLGDLWTQAGGSTERMARAVIVCDEICKLGTRGKVGVARDHARGKARSLLGLWGGGVPLHFSPGVARDRTLAWDSSRAFVLGAGVFRGLSAAARVLTSADLARFGLELELSERLGHIVRLDPLDASQLRRVLRNGLASSAESYRGFGYRLTVPDATCGLVARAVSDGRLPVGARQAVTFLEAAAHARLLALLAADAPDGTEVVLTPDDLVLPEPGSPRRRR